MDANINRLIHAGTNSIPGMTVEEVAEFSRRISSRCLHDDNVRTPAGGASGPRLPVILDSIADVNIRHVRHDRRQPKRDVTLSANEVSQNRGHWRRRPSHWRHRNRAAAAPAHRPKSDKTATQ